MKKLKNILIAVLMLLTAQNIMAQKGAKLMEEIAKMPHAEYLEMNTLGIEKQFPEGVELPFKAGMTKDEFIDAVADEYDNVTFFSAEMKKEDFIKSVQEMDDEEFGQFTVFLSNMMTPLLDMLSGIDEQKIIDLTACNDKTKKKIGKKLTALTKKGFSKSDDISTGSNISISLERKENGMVKEIILLMDGSENTRLFYISGNINMEGFENYVNEMSGKLGKEEL